MSNTLRIITCIWGLLVTVNLSQAQGWRGITPLRSTREEVERLIGSPIEPNGITYVLTNERVNIVYSDGSCEKGQTEWNVPSGTVIGITVYPQTKLMLSELRTDLSGFEKLVNPRNPDYVSYNNKEEGISISTKPDGEVVVIYYLPASKDNYLRCSGSSARQLSKDEMTYYKFDEYADLSFSDEKARLDNFTTYLQREPKLIGYIIAYVGRQTRAGEAKARAERAKNYLVNTCGLDSKRIVAIDGGHREKSGVELYLLPLSVALTAPHPTGVSSKGTFIKNEKSKKDKSGSSREPCNYDRN